MLFEWDEGKRQASLAKHYVDFQDAIRVLTARCSRQWTAVEGKTA